MEVGTAVPTELGVEVECTETRCGEALPTVRQAQAAPSEMVEWRKQQLRDLLAKEFKDFSCQRTTGLWSMLTSLLIEYHDVFILEERETAQCI